MGAALQLAGCGPSRPCLSAWEIALAVPTFGIYNLICRDRANAQQRDEWVQAEVNQCIAQGGDPIGCRGVVYGPAYGAPSVVVPRPAVPAPTPAPSIGGWATTFYLSTGTATSCESVTTAYLAWLKRLDNADPNGCHRVAPPEPGVEVIVCPREGGQYVAASAELCEQGDHGRDSGRRRREQLHGAAAPRAGEHAALQALRR